MTATGRDSEVRIRVLENACNTIWKVIPGMTDVRCEPYEDHVHYRVTAGTEAGAWEIIHKGTDREALWQQMYVSIGEYADKVVLNLINALLERHTAP